MKILPDRELLTDDELATVLQQWVNDLRTTKIKQLRRALLELDDNGKPAKACCLGILCLQGVKRKMIGREVHLECFHTMDDYLETSEEVLPVPFAWQLFGTYAPSSTLDNVDECAVIVDVDEPLLKQHWTTAKQRRRWATLQAYARKTADNYTVLASMNDEVKFTFTEIADVIECSRHINGRRNPIYAAL